MELDLLFGAAAAELGSGRLSLELRKHKLTSHPVHDAPAQSFFTSSLLELDFTASRYPEFEIITTLN